MALRIKELRKAAGWSQDVLAAKAGLSRSQLSEIESETKPANTRRLKAIAEALSVDVTELFEPGARDALMAEVQALLDGMSEEDRDAVLRHARALARRD